MPAPGCISWARALPITTRSAFPRPAAARLALLLQAHLRAATGNPRLSLAGHDVPKAAADAHPSSQGIRGLGESRDERSGDPAFRSVARPPAGAGGNFVRQRLARCRRARRRWRQVAAGSSPQASRAAWTLALTELDRGDSAAARLITLRVAGHRLGTAGHLSRRHGRAERNRSRLRRLESAATHAAHRPRGICFGACSDQSFL